MHKKTFLKTSQFFKEGSQKGSFKKGFTLIEIVIVLGLVVVIFGLVGRKMFSAGGQITDSFRFLSTLNRRLYTSARLHQETYRLVIKLDEKKPEEVWVEKKLKKPQLSQETADEEKENLKEDEVKDFVKDPSFLEKPRKITPLLSIPLVENSHWQEGQTEGLVYVYYFPKGPGPEIAIHFKRPDNQKEWTLYFPPLQRELRLIKKNLSLKDIKREF